MPEYENGMAVTEGEKVGTIVQIDSFGLAAVKTEGDGRIYPFTFDKIRKYRGESPREIGLRLGAQVRFLAADGKIKDVEILPKAV